MIEQDSDILKSIWEGRSKCKDVWCSGTQGEKKEFQERESDEHVSYAAEGSRKMRTENYSLILSKTESMSPFHRRNFYGVVGLKPYSNVLKRENEK